MKRKNQTGSAHVVIMIIVIIVLLGMLGFGFWKNFLSNNNAPSQTFSSDYQEPSAFCKDNEDTSAKDGVFCSDEVGIKFTVPEVFRGKLAKDANYEIFQGPLDFNGRMSAGYSDEVYAATLGQNGDTFTLTIAKEPLRSGYVDVGHLLQGTYFDQATGELTLVSQTSEGTTIKGEVVPSFESDGVRIFKGLIGDAGTIQDTYFGLVNGSIVKVMLTSAFIPSQDSSVFDIDKGFKELDAAMRTLQVKQL